MVSFQSWNTVQGRKRSFIFRIQKVNTVAPRPAAHAHLAKKFLPRHRADVLRFGACLYFFTFYFSPGPFQRFNRGNLIFSLTKLGSFCIILFLFFYFRMTDRTPPRDASRPALTPCTAARHDSRSFTLPCQAGPTKLGDRLSHYGPRVCSRSCASPTSVTLLPSLLSHFH